jgi:hypothetical protein
VNNVHQPRTWPLWSKFANTVEYAVADIPVGRKNGLPASPASVLAVAPPAFHFWGV